FMVLAPEHELVDQITTEDQKAKVDSYVAFAKSRTERDRQSDVKNITGQFTGAYAVHPFTGAEIPIWIADYVLAGYGTGAVMAVPAGDQRDFDFAKKFDLPIPNIFKDADISEEAVADKNAVLCESDFLNDIPGHEAITICIKRMEEMGIGTGRINYRLRDAVFSRQRYWGEPFPVYYEDGIPKLLSDDEQVTLPPVDKYLPTESGEPPLANAKAEDWNIWKGDRMEFNTMPGWAGSSWYFLRYMDPNNTAEFCSRERSDYWKQVDLYMGGAEHATGHLLYARFWTKFLYDRGWIGFNEPFAKMINQGMILGRSSFVYRVKDTNQFVTFEKRKEYQTQRLYADISMVDGDTLDIEAFKNWMPEYNDAEFILNDEGKYTCGSEVEKMSKSKYNVQTPDELCEDFGADTLRCYEMFLGPLEQAKPWDTKGINGVHNFLRKVKRLYDGVIAEESSSAPTKDNLKTLHKTIKKLSEDLDRHSWNTVVSAMMICVNELTDQKCKSIEILKPFTVLLSPYAPHLAEELWEMLGHSDSIVDQAWPVFNEEHLKEDDFEYPVSFNGKMRFKMSLPADMGKADVEAAVLGHEKTSEYLEGNDPKKVIVVPKRIVNIVV
ncbi:MAG: leucine--tRNA ligase, partial [Flavobacteriales bacterium]|nr:leucine--tRNA ligase [Flavobacteriales bacterium]